MFELCSIPFIAVRASWVAHVAVYFSRQCICMVLYCRSSVVVKVKTTTFFSLLLSPHDWLPLFSSSIKQRARYFSLGQVVDVEEAAGEKLIYPPPPPIRMTYGLTKLGIQESL